MMDRAAAMYYRSMWSPRAIYRELRSFWYASHRFVVHGGMRIFVFADMVWSYLRYGANLEDYRLFEFWKKNAHERDSFYTYRRHFLLIKKFDKETFFRLIKKDAQYREYARFIRREWMLADDKTDQTQIRAFIDRNQEVFVKPLSDDSGHGGGKVHADDATEVAAFFESIKIRPHIVEALLQNCHKVSEVNPSSLNTLRVVTVTPKGRDPLVATVFFRAGKGNSSVDNWGSGGIVYPVDIKTGIVSAAGYDQTGNRFLVHPGTNKIMVGFQIPYYQEAVEMALECARLNRKVIFAGLDVALTPNGIELVEYNFPSAHYTLQCFDQVGKNELMQTL